MMKVQEMMNSRDRLQSISRSDVKVNTKDTLVTQYVFKCNALYPI